MAVASSDDSYFVLDPAATDPVRLKKEREKARKLRKSQWWRNQIAPGICHYCQKKFPPDRLTMDHIVPLARGGKTQPGNVRPACPDCNRDKKLGTPVEQIFEQLRKEREERGQSESADGSLRPERSGKRPQEDGAEDDDE